MAFCNSCGATLNPGTRFCNKCGTAVLASTLPPAASANQPSATPTTVPIATAPVPTTQGGGALKIILIVVAVIVIGGALCVAALGFFAWRFARHAHVQQDGDHVKVETPFGSVESSKDPEEVVHNLGVDPYPGARALKEGAATANFGPVHTTSATFESDDSVDKVCSFYKAKFPKAMVSTSDQDRCSIVSNDRKNMITITIQGEGDKTHIQITNVSGKPFGKEDKDDKDDKDKD
jgi:hypothetical protein